MRKFFSLSALLIVGLTFALTGATSQADPSTQLYSVYQYSVDGATQENGMVTEGSVPAGSVIMAYTLAGGDPVLTDYQMVEGFNPVITAVGYPSYYEVRSPNGVLLADYTNAFDGD